MTNLGRIFIFTTVMIGFSSYSKAEPKEESSMPILSASIISASEVVSVSQTFTLLFNPQTEQEKIILHGFLIVFRALDILYRDRDKFHQTDGTLMEASLRIVNLIHQLHGNDNSGICTIGNATCTRCLAKIEQSRAP